MAIADGITMFCLEIKSKADCFFVRKDVHNGANSCYNIFFHRYLHIYMIIITGKSASKLFTLKQGSYAL